MLQFARLVDAHAAAASGGGGGSGGGGDDGLEAWIARCVPFPNSMVDRITPATDDSHRALLAREYGVDDRWPVVAEPFLQWVVEDRFVGGCRPRWEHALGDDATPGAPRRVLLTAAAVEPYELMKLRLLNSTHSALSYVALLLGHERVDAAMADADVRAFARAWLVATRVSVPAVEGVDLDEYCETLLRRREPVREGPAHPPRAGRLGQVPQHAARRAPRAARARRAAAAAARARGRARARADAAAPRSPRSRATRPSATAPRARGRSRTRSRRACARSRPTRSRARPRPAPRRPRRRARPRSPGRAASS